MRSLIILELNTPTPEDAARALAAVDPPTIPGFAGTARMAVDPVAAAIIDYLDGGDDATQDALSGIYAANCEAPNPIDRDLVRRVHLAYIVANDPDPAGFPELPRILTPTPDQRDDLLTLLRAVYVALPATDKEPNP